MPDPEPLSDAWFEARFRELLGPCDGGVRGKFREVAAAALEWAEMAVLGYVGGGMDSGAQEVIRARIRAKAREIREGE